MGHRRGRGRILTADELREVLTIPVFYILLKQAQAAFPETATPHPSSFIQIILVGNRVEYPHRSRFPVTVNWRQWQTIVAPILERLGYKPQRAKTNIGLGRLSLQTNEQAQGVMGS